LTSEIEKSMTMDFDEAGHIFAGNVMRVFQRPKRAQDKPQLRERGKL
jgi:hypothetical protein